MTLEEFVEVGNDVLAEYMPKSNATVRREVLLALADELRDQGLDIDEVEEEESDDDDDLEEIDLG
jgi:hypothetical protein